MNRVCVWKVFFIIRERRRERNVRDMLLFIPIKRWEWEKGRNWNFFPVTDSYIDSLLSINITLFCELFVSCSVSFLCKEREEREDGRLCACLMLSTFLSWVSFYLSSKRGSTGFSFSITYGSKLSSWSHDTLNVWQEIDLLDRKVLLQVTSLLRFKNFLPSSLSSSLLCLPIKV